MLGCERSRDAKAGGRSSIAVEWQLPFARPGQRRGAEEVPTPQRAGERVLGACRWHGRERDGNKREINLLAAYAPTGKAGPRLSREREVFYGELDRLASGTPPNGFTIIGGDFNGQVGARKDDLWRRSFTS